MERREKKRKESFLNNKLKSSRSLHLTKYRTELEDSIIIKVFDIE